MPKHIIYDVEGDGPCPGLYSMVCFGVVGLFNQTKTFYGKTAPITDKYIPEALAVSGFTREEHERFENPSTVMKDFYDWVKDFGGGERVVAWSDNPAYDWQFLNYYFARTGLENPLGFSSRRIGDLFAGFNGNWRDNTSWKSMRDTRHTHNPVDDAKGNAEALVKILEMNCQL